MGFVRQHGAGSARRWRRPPNGSSPSAAWLGL